MRSSSDRGQSLGIRDQTSRSRRLSGVDRERARVREARGREGPAAVQQALAAVIKLSRGSLSWSRCWRHSLCGGGWGSFVWRVAGLIFYVRCSWRGGDGRMRAFTFTSRGQRGGLVWRRNRMERRDAIHPRRRPAPPPSDIGWARSFFVKAPVSSSTDDNAPSHCSNAAEKKKRNVPNNACYGTGNLKPWGICGEEVCRGCLRCAVDVEFGIPPGSVS